MAKKNKKKAGMNPIIKAEITGFLCLAASILLLFGIGQFSRLISSVFIFFIGYGILPIYAFILIFAVMTIIGRKVPQINFVQKIALLIAFISLLVVLSIGEVTNDPGFIQFTDDLFFSISKYIKTKEFGSFFGGIGGFLLTDVFISLFNFTGNIIIVVTVLIV